jgi:hypothetical protein
MPATTCNDLNRDSALTVYDAALINWCRRSGPLHPAGSTHNHCNFPRNIVNPAESVILSISNVDFTGNYIDVQMVNPNSNIAAYQFSVSGVTISSVVSLVNPVQFPADVRYISGTNEVIAISLQDSSILRSNTPQALVRIYFSAVTDTLICISHVTDMVNSAAERVLTVIAGNCFAATVTSVPSVAPKAELVLIPNPAHDRALIHLNESNYNINDLQIMDMTGKTFNVPTGFSKDSWFEISLENLPRGVYIITVKGASGRDAIKLVRY